jgi:cysteine desulfuration protein SufE
MSPIYLDNAEFIDEIGLKEHLSPTRANGLVSMIKKIKMYAVAYQTQIGL